MLITLLYVLFFVSCLVLVATILLQPGKTDAGALFTSSISSTAFGPRGTQSVLSRITIAAAAMFMLTALLIAMPALSGNSSVLNSVTETTAPATTTDAAPSAETNSNTAIVIPADANTAAPNGATGNANAAVNK